MKLEHLTNKSATNLYSELSSALIKAGEFFIASAFINDEAIKLTAASLKKNKKLQGRILIGLYNFFNKKKDLEALLQLVNSNPAQLQVHISLDQCFHWKYYHFVTGQKQAFYIGSANFTSSGMIDNGELVVKLSDIKSSNRSLENLATSFKKEWVHSRPLSEFPLQHYCESKPSAGPAGGAHQEIKEFFDQKVKHTHSSKADSGKLYALYVQQKVSASTRKAINNQKSSWLTNGWDFLVLRSLAEYRQCLKVDYLLFFDGRGRRNVTAERIERMDQDENIATPDGNYFIAYKMRSQKRLTSDEIDQLKAPKFKMDLLGRKKKFSTKMLGKNQAAEVLNLLKL